MIPDYQVCVVSIIIVSDDNQKIDVTSDIGTNKNYWIDEVIPDHQVYAITIIIASDDNQKIDVASDIGIHKIKIIDDMHDIAAQKGGITTKNNILQATHVYEDAQRRLEELVKAKQSVEMNLAIPIKGKIHIIKSRGKVQYYVRYNRRDKSGKYLSKKEKDKIRKYVQHKYDEEVYSLINREIQSLERLINKSFGIVEKIRNKYSNNPQEIKNLISPVDMSDGDLVESWLSEEYAGKNMSDDIPAYITEKGERVRSKSELTIANKLYKANIPYKYEHPLILSTGRVIYPDFTLLNINERREIYWEHRGMMDNPEYAAHAIQRIRQYSANNIFLGEGLIISEESTDNPLGTDEIDRIIMHYFG